MSSGSEVRVVVHTITDPELPKPPRLAPNVSENSVGSGTYCTSWMCHQFWCEWQEVLWNMSGGCMSKFMQLALPLNKKIRDEWPRYGPHLELMGLIQLSYSAGKSYLGQMWPRSCLAQTWPISDGFFGSHLASNPSGLHLGHLQTLGLRLAP